MYALLIMNKSGKDLRIMVKLRDKKIQDKVSLFLDNNQKREAFDLLKTQAQVESYLPAGAKISRIPEVTLVEDLI